jgi:la-related protein 1
MDSEGFVKLTFIANFARVKTLTQSYEQLKDAVLSSRVLEVATSANGEGVRRKGDWQPWVRAPEDRDPSVVGTPGPWTILAERPATEIHQAFQTAPQMVNGYINGYHGEQSNGHAPHVHGFNGGNWYPPQMQNQPAHIEKQNGLSAEVPSFTPRTSKTSKQSHQPDVYPDSALDALVIVLTGSGADLGQSRPTPNGFLKGEAPAPKYHPISNADSDFAASSNSVVEDSNTSLGWIDPAAGEDMTIPIPAGAVHRAYLAFKANVLEQRKANNKVAEMAILYRFWRHFLLCHFNRNTYFEFRQYAMEDNRNGLQLGFDYYLGYLKYVHLAKQQPPLLVTSDLLDLSKDYESALEVLRSVYHDSTVPAATKSQIEGRLDAATKEKLA